MSFQRFQVAPGAGASAFADKGASANRFAKLFDPTLALHYKFAAAQSLTDFRAGLTLGLVRAADTATRVNAQGFIEDVAANIGRFDFDPATKRSLGLLIEEPRTNLIQFSGNLFTAPWVSLRTPLITANSAISPRGLLEATLLNDNNTSNPEGVVQSITVSDNTNTYVISLYVKKDSGISNRTMGIDIEFTGGTITTPVELRLNTETGETNGEGGFGTQATDFGDWWRIQASVANNGLGNTTLKVTVLPATSSIGTFIDAGATIGTAHVWGMQVEIGTFPTSYIETAGAAILRNGDLPSTTDVSWLNTAAGTVFAEYSHLGVTSSANHVWTLHDNATSRRINHHLNGLGIGRTRSNFFAANGGTIASLLDDNDLPANTISRSVLAWAANDWRAHTDGRAAVVDGSGIPPVISELAIGYQGVTNIQFLNGHMREWRYHNVRKPNGPAQNLSKGIIPA